ncbi:MAG TPA: methane monooxygenase/ammonia monooxygenase subunit B [Actinomycetota bacterium]|jgi:methane/ammonia monooxygenase subunit B
MWRRLMAAFFGAAALTFVLAPAASAHGEKSQEGFLRMRTVAWQDVKFSSDNVQQGQTLTVTGTVKIMDAWPSSLAKGQPNTCYMGMVSPGPTILIKERTINGVSMPTRIDCAKGKIYDFSMTVAGRRVGKWHVHPSFSVKGAGTLIGPGEWLNITKNPAGFRNEATLLNGKTVNLENYNLTFIWFWLIATALIGVAWMLYWTVPRRHRTVTNLAVTSQIPLNTDGGEYGLITKRDHRDMNIFLVVSIAVLAVGWIYQAAAYPTKIPQQIIQFAPPDIPRPAPTVSVDEGKSKAIYDANAKQVILQVTAKNEGKTDAQLNRFYVADLTWFNQAVPDSKPTGPQAVDTTYAMNVENDTIAPGGTQDIKITMPSDVWIKQEKLLPIGESQLTVTGLLHFQPTSGGGDASDVEVDEPLTPTSFKI